jgi:hypothetical protein
MKMPLNVKLRLSAKEAAQDTFKRMLRTQVAPALREMGFKGSGQHYLMPHGEYWALLGFQRHKYSDAKEVRFTVNVSAGSKAGWSTYRSEHPFLPERPSANMYGGYLAWERIGALLPETRDKWWCVRAGAATAGTAEEVLVAIRRYALPWLSERMKR